MELGDRHSIAGSINLIEDNEARARREVANGLRQFSRAMEIVRSHVLDGDRPFRLRSSHLLELNYRALEGINAFAGTYRNVPIEITGSAHTPPPPFLIAEEVERMCAYVNDGWSEHSALHHAAYLMWRINWIHPFADGNGRTSRMVSYMVLNIHLNSILPGVPAIPDQIAEDKTPYYDALEEADRAFGRSGKVDVVAMEALIEPMLARQLLNATETAAGRRQE